MYTRRCFGGLTAHIMMLATTDASDPISLDPVSAAWST